MTISKSTIQNLANDIIYIHEQGFKYITLGSEADNFYEKCGYKVIFQIRDQKSKGIINL